MSMAEIIASPIERRAAARAKAADGLAVPVSRSVALPFTVPAPSLVRTRYQAAGVGQQPELIYDDGSVVPIDLDWVRAHNIKAEALGLVGDVVTPATRAAGTLDDGQASGFGIYTPGTTMVHGSVVNAPRIVIPSTVLSATTFWALFRLRHATSTADIAVGHHPTLLAWLDSLGYAGANIELYYNAVEGPFSPNWEVFVQDGLAAFGFVDGAIQSVSIGQTETVGMYIDTSAELAIVSNGGIWRLASDQVGAGDSAQPFIGTFSGLRSFFTVGGDDTEVSAFEQSDINLLWFVCGQGAVKPDPALAFLNSDTPPTIEQAQSIGASALCQFENDIYYDLRGLP